MAKLSIKEQAALEEKLCQERRQRFREAAERFASKAASLQNVHEVALCGSMVTDDPYPNDIDLAIVVDSLAELSVIARAARQISSTYHGWEVFVFRPERAYVGRICHRRECPREMGRCDNMDCGHVPFLGNLRDFNFDPTLFLAPPIKILWCREPKSMLLDWKEALGARLSDHQTYRPITLKCWECGRRFLFSVGEQKIFAKRGFREPKRCELCRLKRQYGKDAVSVLLDLEEEERHG
ncbi:MAG: zinc-ribbon domain containing protein [Candidatus Binatia bacterium]